MRAGTTSLLIVAVITVLGGSALADAIMLRDGRIMSDLKLKREGDALLILYENGTVRVPLDIVEDYVIEGEPPPEPRTEEEKQKRAEGFVPYQGKWVKPGYREKQVKREIERKKAEIEEHRKHRDWANPYRIDTKHFRFLSTLPPRVNDEYTAIIEAFFREFKKLWKVRVPKDWGKLEVYFHRDRKTFRDRGGAGGGALAYYKFVPPRELHFFYDGRDPEKTIAVLFHEVNHYLTDLIAERFNHPHWCGEAMAEYYGGTEWDPVKKKLTVGKIQAGRLLEVQSDMAKDDFYGLREMILKEGGDYKDYYWGWSFVHFLMNSPRYAKKFRKFFSDIGRARDVARVPYSAGLNTITGAESLRVLQSRLGVKNLDALEKEWYAYVKGLDFEQLRGMEEAGISAYRQGRTKFRAPRFLKGAIEEGSRNPEVYARYADCLAAKAGSREDAVKMMEKACELDPLDADLRARLGFLLIRFGQKEKGEKLVELAKEMDPDNDYLMLEIMRKLSDD